MGVIDQQRRQALRRQALSELIEVGLHHSHELSPVETASQALALLEEHDLDVRVQYEASRATTQIHIDNIDGESVVVVLNRLRAQLREEIAQEIEAAAPSPGDGYASSSDGWTRVGMIAAVRIVRGEA